MLVLTRRETQSIIIGDITFMICSIEGKSVKVGIKAPKEIKVWRSELVKVIEKE